MFKKIAKNVFHYYYIMGEQIQISVQLTVNIDFKNFNLLKYTKELQTIIDKKINHVENIPIKNSKNAVLIGCNYKNTMNELNGCINDANNIKQLLTNGYGFDNIVFMTDDTEKTPTKKNILDELKALLNNANSGDILFFSFSGHGINLKDKNRDEKDGLDEVMVAIDFNYIRDDELNRLIQDNLKKDVTLFALFDCCHSGTILDLRYQYLDSTSFNENTEQLNNLETQGNVIMISGSMDSQTSEDAYIKAASSYQGAMTYAFIETLKKTPNSSWNDLLKSMREYLKKNNYSQIPQLSSGKKLDLMLNFLSAA